MNQKDEFTRIRIGIGLPSLTKDRPSSREPAAVSNYVLSNFSKKEQMTINEEVYPAVEKLIKDLTK